MPPAFVLSQDQTLKFVSRYKSSQPKGQPSHRTELQEPIPALVKRNGYEGHIRHRLNQPVSRAHRPPDRAKIGRASCRDRVCQYVSISVDAGELKKKVNNKQHAT